MNNKEQKLDFIRQACNKANPALMELRFGCEVEYMPKQQKGIYLHGDLYWVVWFPWGVKSDDGENFYKLLGRLPSLADVLNAIGMKSSKHWAVKDDGEIIDFYSDKNFDKRIKWNLLLPFDQQDEVAISFIFEILK